MTIYGAQHPKTDVYGLYLQRYEGRRDLIELDVYVQVEVHSLEKYVSNLKGKILKAVGNSKTIENSKYGRNKKEIH